MKSVCLITGAGGMLGNALIDALIAKYDIIATYNRTLPKYSSQFKFRINSEDLWKPNIDRNEVDKIFCVQADLTKKEDIKRLIEVSFAKFGQIDILINSAADLSFHGNLLELAQVDDYAISQLNLNSVAPFYLISSIFDYFWKHSPQENFRNNRSVINISSKSSLNVYGNNGQAFYSASKAALNILTLHLAKELATYFVRSNVICPGSFSDKESLSKVVKGIISVIENRQTGIILTNFDT